MDRKKAEEVRHRCRGCGATSAMARQGARARLQILKRFYLPSHLENLGRFAVKGWDGMKADAI